MRAFYERDDGCKPVPPVKFMINSYCNRYSILSNNLKRDGQSRRDGQTRRSMRRIMIQKSRYLLGCQDQDCKQAQTRIGCAFINADGFCWGKDAQIFCKKTPQDLRCIPAAAPLQAVGNGTLQTLDNSMQDELDQYPEEANVLTSLAGAPSSCDYQKTPQLKASSPFCRNATKGSVCKNTEKKPEYAKYASDCVYDTVCGKEHAMECPNVLCKGRLILNLCVCFRIGRVHRKEKGWDGL